jgi:ElaB/YqjD/DUF883 family membrane-anchored ribosome-binding protein
MKNLVFIIALSTALASFVAVKASENGTPLAIIKTSIDGLDLERNPENFTHKSLREKCAALETKSKAFDANAILQLNDYRFIQKLQQAEQNEIEQVLKQAQQTKQLLQQLQEVLQTKSVQEGQQTENNTLLDTINQKLKQTQQSEQFLQQLQKKNASTIKSQKSATDNHIIQNPSKWLYFASFASGIFVTLLFAHIMKTYNILPLETIK